MIIISASRSSISEGQIRGSFSDGELVRLTPRGRDILEDGELLHPPPSSPLPPPPSLPENRIDGQPPSARGGGGDAGGGARSAARRWSSDDPRQHLTLLMSAHPRLRSSQSSRRRAGAGAGAGGDGGDAAAAAVVGSSRREPSEPREPFSRTVLKNGADSGRTLVGGTIGTDDGRSRRRSKEAGLAGYEGTIVAGAGFFPGDFGASSSLSDGECSDELGMARAPGGVGGRRSPWEGVPAGSSSDHRYGGIPVDVGMRRGVGRRRRGEWHQPFSDGSSSTGEAGDCSSGAELGEQVEPATLARGGGRGMVEDELFGGGGGGGGEGRWLEDAGERRSRPMAVLAAGGAGSSDRRSRWVTPSMTRS